MLEDVRVLSLQGLILLARSFFGPGKRSRRRNGAMAIGNGEASGSRGGFGKTWLEQDEGLVEGGGGGGGRGEH